MDHSLHFTFSVQLTETVTVMAPDEDAARAFLAQGFGKYAGPTRKNELEGVGRTLKQSLQQHAGELLSVEDPMAPREAEERERWGGRTATEYGKALEERWQRLEARVKALEGALARPRADD
ncbi:hypothetical protein DF3PB_4410005 [uncultured Defluviicoccus sp.]|uniref:Uncharacterized protein n=1 Tax=metagenome TaxID=256318 RepID=A0A380THH2_9ZZZZ|nr:hypothetical protein DF3PB_4410005 [uncultured Defluviicoccus sp.]